MPPEVYRSNGFEVVDTSARVSLANLTEIEYAAIGKFSRQVLDECHADFNKSTAAKEQRLLTVRDLSAPTPS
jgi:hypothetical protein